jgi:hypothetical protein
MPELLLNPNQPAVYASPHFIEAADFVGTVAITVNNPDLTRVIQMARGSRGTPPNIGAVTLQLSRELPHLHSPLLHPVTSDVPLGETEPVRLRDIQNAASEQEVKLLRVRAGGLDPEQLGHATYMAAARKLTLWFGSMGGMTLGLAAHVIESGIRSHASLPRMALYMGVGALVGTVGHPLLSRAKYHYDRPVLEEENRRPIRLTIDHDA